ncbi:hypothetical protein EC951288_0292A, partial [Escherichia coli 95.1288]
MSQPL